MAETLGSLIDKLTIKAIRSFHIMEMKKQKRGKFSKMELAEKLSVLNIQKRRLFLEIEAFVQLAVQGKVHVRDEKLKLYNKLEVMGKVGTVKSLSHAIERLGQKNLELWQLEDEARREDVDSAYIGNIKRKIDVANQHRNDLIDLVDEMLERKISKQHNRNRKSGRKVIRHKR